MGVNLSLGSTLSPFPVEDHTLDRRRERVTPRKGERVDPNMV
jgi:hypothetical protein